MVLERGLAGEIEVFRRRADKARCTFVLLHGVGSHALSFEPLMQALSPSIEAIAWNAPGYGESKPLAIERTELVRIDPKLVQPRGPLLQLGPVGAAEADVVEADAMFAEFLIGGRAVVLVDAD